jgi:hypothetical protein
MPGNAIYARVWQTLNPGGELKNKKRELLKALGTAQNNAGPGKRKHH